MGKYDVIIVGAGAAGLMAAATAQQQGRKTAILEMGKRPARKVAVSGGGFCNITNTNISAARYFGKNPHFVHSALNQFTPTDMLTWAQKHSIRLYEKTPGRYFCTDGAQAVVNALMADVSGADIFYNISITDINKNDNIFYIKTSDNTFTAKSIIIATGGISFPTLGVSDFGYKIAKQFGHKIIPVRPGLCMISITDNPYTEFSGISLQVELTVGKTKIYDDMLFTHMGIGGPAAYRASLYDLDNGININLLPDVDMMRVLTHAKQTNGKKQIIGLLSEYLPNRIAKYIAQNDTRNIADIKNTELGQITERVHNIHIPNNKIKLHSMHSAEVTFGGISTDEISSKTMESKLCPGLFFAGEVLDVTGDLGGFNLQWAWSSGVVAGKNA